MRENSTARSTLPPRITAHTCAGLPSTVVYSLLKCAMVIPVEGEGSRRLEILDFRAWIIGKDHKCSEIMIIEEMTWEGR